MDTASATRPFTPFRITVQQLISSRYPGGVRPLSWDLRTAGIDVVETSDGQKLRLQSDGGQSPPQSGWVLLLTGGDDQEGFSWTLYGLH